jgi:hypothetical protein
MSRAATKAASRAALLNSKCIVLAESQQLDRRLTVGQCFVGERVECIRVASEAYMPQGKETRPLYGKIKAARCGPDGCAEKVGISVPSSEVPVSPQPGFLDNAKEINTRRTSHKEALSVLAVRSDRSVAPRINWAFCSAQVSWHTWAMACPGVG